MAVPPARPPSSEAPNCVHGPPPACAAASPATPEAPLATTWVGSPPASMCAKRGACCATAAGAPTAMAGRLPATAREPAETNRSPGVSGCGSPVASSAAEVRSA